MRRRDLSLLLPRLLLPVAGIAALAGAAPSTGTVGQAGREGIGAVQTIVVLYAENRSFDNLYGRFPGARGLQGLAPAAYQQRDRDGSVLPSLPVVWGGLTVAGQRPVVTQAMTAGLANKPFAIDARDGFDLPLDVITHDLVHRFYQEQMQIDHGRNDRFVAWGNSGAMPMGYYDGSGMALWQVARRYVLADNFFLGAFGGSFLNHQYLICACAPIYPDAAHVSAHPSIAVVDGGPAGTALRLAPNSPASALQGVPKFVADGNITPDGYAVNTMQPPYQPSHNPPPRGGDPELADRAMATTLPPQTGTTIGDLLSRAGVSWAWYAGAWSEVLAHGNARPVPDFQYHHQPFNYYAAYAPGTAARAAHLRDGGLGGAAFIADIDAGRLPQVTFYKPQGNLNQHSGYADVASGDAHLADLVRHLERAPQWAHMLVIITYDENGGIWDHVAPPPGDRWGPGNRVPALIVSPFAKRGFVDHTQYDTGSVLRLISERFSLPLLPGLAKRDAALQQHGAPPMGDLTAALDLPK